MHFSSSSLLLLPNFGFTEQKDIISEFSLSSGRGVKLGPKLSAAFNDSNMPIKSTAKPIKIEIV